jgi:hypothetical protein
MYELLSISVAIVIALIALKKIYSVLSTRKLNKYLTDVVGSSPYRKVEPMQKPQNDFLLRNIELEDKKQDKLSSDVTKYDPHELGVEKTESHEESRIVGIAEPQGFWSKFVMSQKLGHILARLGAQQSSDKGFWVNLIKAQGMSQGKDQSRGR